MRRRSTDGKRAKSPRHKAITLQPRNATKSVRGRSSFTSQETKIAQLTRERDEALILRASSSVSSLAATLH